MAGVVVEWWAAKDFRWNGVDGSFFLVLLPPRAAGQWVMDEWVTGRVSQARVRVSHHHHHNQYHVGGGGGEVAAVDAGGREGGGSGVVHVRCVMR